jgi:hypothetical protein
MTEQKRSVLIAAASLFAAVAIVVIVTGEMLFSRQFSSVEWKSVVRGTDWQVEQNLISCARKEMISSLESSFLRKGMRREEIASLLGEPQARSKSVDCWNYVLGYCGRIDTAYYHVCFDSDDRVRSFGPN